MKIDSKSPPTWGPHFAWLRRLAFPQSPCPFVPPSFPLAFLPPCLLSFDLRHSLFDLTLVTSWSRAFLPRCPCLSFAIRYSQFAIQWCHNMTFEKMYFAKRTHWAAAMMKHNPNNTNAALQPTQIAQLEGDRRFLVQPHHEMTPKSARSALPFGDRGAPG